MEDVSQRVLDVLSNKFAHIWRVNDETWLKERKQAWQPLADYYSRENTPESDVIRYRKFFVYGEYLGYMPSMLFYVPFESGKILRSFLFSDIYNASERAAQISKFFSISYNLLEKAPWKRKFNQMFVIEILGEKYQETKESLPGGGEEIISLDPSHFCSSFIICAFKIFNKKREYHPYLEAVGYFVTALPHFTDPYWRSSKRRKQFYEMLDLAESCMHREDVTPIAKELAEKLINRKQEILNNWNINAHLDEE